MTTKFLPGIHSIGYVEVSKLQPDILSVADPDKKIKVYGTFTDIPIIKKGSMVIATELVKGVTIYSVTILFQICATDDIANKICDTLQKNIHSFKFTNVNGDKMLIGLNEKPYPTVTSEYNNESSPTGQRGYSVSINYRNTYPFLYLE